MGVADAHVVDDDWLVCEDILVFGGHSTLGEGEEMVLCGGVSSSCCCCWAHGTVSPREQRRVCWWPAVFLKSANMIGRHRLISLSSVILLFISICLVRLFWFLIYQHCHNHTGSIAHNNSRRAQQVGGHKFLQMWVTVPTETHQPSGFISSILIRE
jgi:hypothetical protein